MKERERERERETETETETERQTDRDRQRQRQTDRQTETETESESDRDRQTDRQRDWRSKPMDSASSCIRNYFNNVIIIWYTVCYFLDVLSGQNTIYQLTKRTSKRRTQYFMLFLGSYRPVNRTESPQDRNKRKRRN